MFSLSNCLIELDESPNFLKLSSLIYLFALLMIIQSGLIIPIKIGCVAVIVVILRNLYKKPYPMHRIKNLAYITDHWIVETKNNQQLYFDKHNILLEAGLFFLLKLTNETHSKVFVIFFDQIDEKIYRALKIIEKIR